MKVNGTSHAAVCTCLGKCGSLGHQEPSVLPVAHSLKGNLWYIQAKDKPSGKKQSCSYVPPHYGASWNPADFQLPRLNNTSQTIPMDLFFVFLAEDVPERTSAVRLLWESRLRSRKTLAKLTAWCCNIKTRLLVTQSLLLNYTACHHCPPAPGPYLSSVTGPARSQCLQTPAVSTGPTAHPVTAQPEFGRPSRERRAQLAACGRQQHVCSFPARGWCLSRAVIPDLTHRQSDSGTRFTFAVPSLYGSVQLLVSHGLQRISTRPRVARHRASRIPPPSRSRERRCHRVPATTHGPSRLGRAAPGPPHPRPAPRRPRTPLAPRPPCRAPQRAPADRRRGAGWGHLIAARPPTRGLTLCRRRSRAARLKTSRGRTRRQS